MIYCLFCACEKDQRPLVVGKIQAASKLATTEFTIDKIVHGTKTKKLFWVVKLNEARFLAYSKAIIKTGIDLNDIKPEDIKIDGSKIELQLPQVTVLNFSYPPREFRLDEEITDNKFLNVISLEDQEEFFRRAELDIRNNLEYMGLVETTQQHTRTLLRGLLKSLGYQEIYISFTSNELAIDKVDLGTAKSE
ncbi:DUF4230 domain-containing protein [Aquimarina brevivitae]|uniref:Uncharacterized protein DUF4230 n=1 Tax=Aquimarina brevivitae TaxID=323412 RepID=A0A4Q7P0H7_9FLAO|nr:DUF4230 domain-containing protein [Aquimarina brevivitae]RZS93291.1 uncharacterized protein DUF4230 [Aquimarina brevivitae]